MADRPARVLVVGHAEPALSAGGRRGRISFELLRAGDLAGARDLLGAGEVEAVLAGGLDEASLKELVRTAGEVPVVALTPLAADPCHACLPPDASPAAVAGALAGAVFRRRAESLTHLLEAAASLMDEALCAADGRGRIVLTNRAFDELFGFDRGESLGRSVRTLWEDAGEYEALRDLVRERFAGSLDRDVLLRRADGTSFPATLTVSLVSDPRGREAAVVGVIRAAPGEDRLDAALECLSGLDGLTGLPTRGRFEVVLESEWRRARRLGHPLAVILADIDDFGRFNDLYGPKAGDRCLQEVARVLGDFLKRAGNLAARWGGEEFAILLPASSLQQAALAADHLRRGIETLAVPHQGSPFSRLTASFGVAAAVPAETGRPAELLELARTALEEAREAGGNRVASREPPV